MSYKQMLRGLTADHLSAMTEYLPAETSPLYAIINCLNEALQSVRAETWLQTVVTDSCIGLPLIVLVDGWQGIEPISDTDLFVTLGTDPDAVIDAVPWLREVSSEHEEIVAAAWDQTRAIVLRCWGYSLPIVEYIGVRQNDHHLLPSPRLLVSQPALLVDPSDSFQSTGRQSSH
jgi:hypothetical protein